MPMTNKIQEYGNLAVGKLYLKIKQNNACIHHVLMPEIFAKLLSFRYNLFMVNNANCLTKKNALKVFISIFKTNVA